MYIEILQPKVDHSKLVELGHMMKGTTPTKAASTSDLMDYALRQAELHQQRLSTIGASSII